MELKDDLQEAVKEYILTELSYPYKREDIDYGLIQRYYSTLGFGIWYRERATSTFLYNLQKALKKEKNILKKIVIYLNAKLST